MIKKQWLFAVLLFLLIPLASLVQGMVFRLIDPESAAGHPDYARRFHELSQLRMFSFWGYLALVFALWWIVSLLVIGSKKQSGLWVFLALFGPFGFAVLASLNDRAPSEKDSYSRFVQSLNTLLRVGFELCTFAIVWPLAYEGMVLKRMLMISYQAATSGMSAAQIIDLQNASSGMWAFAEGNEVIYLVVLLYLLRPIIFNIAARAVAMRTFPQPQ